MTRSYSSYLFWLGLTIAASLMLYHTSDRVNELEQKLRSLNAQIDSEQENLHVLKAEWVYLANPERVQAEARRHLDLQPTAPSHVTALTDIGALLPLQNGAEPLPQIQTAQNAPAPLNVITQAQVSPTAPLRHDHIASLNARHINDHMNMQHTAAAVPTDRIGALIGTLGLNP